MGLGGRKGDGVGSIAGCCSLSVALIISGAVFIARGNGGYSRDEQISIYNRAVLNWQNGGENAFQAQGPFQVSITCSTMSACGATGGVATNLTLASAVNNPVGVEVNSGISVDQISDRVVYQTASNIFSQPLIQSSNTAKSTITLSRPGSATPLSTTQADLSYFSQTSKGKGACQYGQQQGGQCMGYFVPDIGVGPLCLVVDTNNNIVGGCGIMSQQAAEALKYFWAGADALQSSAPWKINFFSFQYTSTYPSSFPWPASPSFPSVVVRSVNDPWVVFIGLTGGYSTFGYREGESLKKGKILIGVGFGLFAPFLFCCIFAVCMGLVDSCCKRSYVPSSTPVTTSTPSSVLAPTPVSISSPMHHQENTLRRPTFSESVRRRFDQTFEVAGRPFDRAGDGLRTATSRVFRGSVAARGPRLDAQGQPLPDTPMKAPSTAPPMMLEAGGRDSFAAHPVGTAPLSPIPESPSPGVIAGPPGISGARMSYANPLGSPAQPGPGSSSATAPLTYGTDV